MNERVVAISTLKNHLIWFPILFDGWLWCWRKFFGIKYIMLLFLNFPYQIRCVKMCSLLHKSTIPQVSFHWTHFIKKLFSLVTTHSELEWKKHWKNTIKSIGNNVRMMREKQRNTMWKRANTDCSVASLSEITTKQKREEKGLRGSKKDTSFYLKWKF